MVGSLFYQIIKPWSYHLHVLKVNDKLIISPMPHNDLLIHLKPSLGLQFGLILCYSWSAVQSTTLTLSVLQTEPQSVAQSTILTLGALQTDCRCLFCDLIFIKVYKSVSEGIQEII